MLAFLPRFAAPDAGALLRPHHYRSRWTARCCLWRQATCLVVSTRLARLGGFLRGVSRGVARSTGTATAWTTHATMRCAVTLVRTLRHFGLTPRLSMPLRRFRLLRISFAAVFCAVGIICWFSAWTAVALPHLFSPAVNHRAAIAMYLAGAAFRPAV